MDFRTVKVNDFNLINGLSKKLMETHFEERPDILLVNVMSAKDFKKRVKSKMFVGIIGYENNEIIAYSMCRIFENSSNKNAKRKTLFVDEFYVIEQFRNKGLGHEFFKIIKNVAINKGCDDIELQVYSFNTNAIKFYEKNCMTEQRKIMEIRLTK